MQSSITSSVKLEKNACLLHENGVGSSPDLFLWQARKMWSGNKTQRRREVGVGRGGRRQPTPSLPTSHPSQTQLISAHNRNRLDMKLSALNILYNFLFLHNHYRMPTCSISCRLAGYFHTCFFGNGGVQVSDAGGEG